MVEIGNTGDCSPLQTTPPGRMAGVLLFSTRRYTRKGIGGQPVSNRTDDGLLRMDYSVEIDEEPPSQGSTSNLA